MAIKRCKITALKNPGAPTPVADALTELLQEGARWMLTAVRPAIRRAPDRGRSSSPGRARVGADDRGIDQDALQIRPMRAARVQCLPDAVAAPAGKALEDRIPLALLSGQQTPLRPRPQHPQEGPASRLRCHADMLVGHQNRIDCIPFFVADFEPVQSSPLTLATRGGYVNRT